MSIACLLLALAVAASTPTPKATIVGTVLNAASGEPIAGATIGVSIRKTAVGPDGSLHLDHFSFMQGADIQGVTDADGRFSIDVDVDHVSEIVAVTAHAPGFEDRVRSIVTVAKLRSTRVTFDLISGNPTSSDLERIEARNELERDRLYEADEGVSSAPESTVGVLPKLLVTPTNFSVPDQVWVSNLAGYTGYIDFDEFIAGVVSAELGDTFPFESLKAQAVAARSYALERYNRLGYANGGQAYSSSLGVKSHDAALNTNKIVLTYGGNVISAVFSARCNGDATLNSEDGLSGVNSCVVGGLFNGAYIAYLRSRTCSGHSNCSSTSEPCCNRYVEGRWQYIYGHGVGMCQRGAGQFAGVYGQDWQTILNDFYTSVSIENGPGLTAGSSVTVASNGINVRDSACGSPVGTVNAGATGVIQTGPSRVYCTLVAGTFYVTWWQVSFNGQPAVWIAEDFLQRSSSPPPQQLPTVGSTYATNVTMTSATLNTSVNPNGSDTWVNFLYDNNTKSTPVLDIGSGNATVPVAQDVTGLVCGTQYSFRVTASNGGGTYQQSVYQYFTTSACQQQLPTVGSTYATNVTTTSATLNTSVNPNGSDTWVNFLYDNNTKSTPVLDIGSGNAAVPVAQDVSGLVCGTQYSFRVTASNGAGTFQQSSYQYFTTSACPASPATVGSTYVSSITATGATLNTSVNPNGTDTWVNFQYDNNTKSTPVIDIGAGSAPVPVAQSVSGLSCNTQYSYRVIASNGGGTVQSSLQSFATGPCQAHGFYLVTPCRLIDTRNPNGPQGGPSLAAGATRNVVAVGVCGIPSGVTSLSVNLTAVAPSASGWLTLFPGPAGAAVPWSSTLNYLSRTIANNAIVPVGSDGSINVYNSGPNADQFIIDVNGYFQ